MSTGQAEETTGNAHIEDAVVTALTNANHGTIQLLRADARDLPIADASVDLIITSPPYYRLRSYTDGGTHYAGQIGDEPTPREYVESLIQVTRECMRVLKPSGSLWVNLGDKYARRGGADRSKRTLTGAGRGSTARVATPTSNDAGGPEKSLIGIPWRYALRCIDDLELILRAEVIWSKTNGLPESVTDRTRRAHENWFHFTTQPHYYSAVDQIREQTGIVKPRGSNPNGPSPDPWDRGQPTTEPHPLGKLPSSVRDVPTQPLDIPDHIAHATCCAGAPRADCEDALDHYAAFPMEWPRWIINGWAPTRGICTACGEGRRPVVDKPGLLGGDNNPESRNGARRFSTMDGGQAEWARRSAIPDRIIGYACACTPFTDHPPTGRRSNRRADNPYGKPGREQGVYSNKAGEYVRVGARRDHHFDRWDPAPTRRPVVLDPFGGTGTTALVASVLGCDAISVDLSGDYSNVIARWRTTDPGQIAAAMQVPKPVRQITGQASLFDQEVPA